ncbi:MAG: LCP family protein [Sphingobacteriaceae bacterium]
MTKTKESTQNNKKLRLIIAIAAGLVLVSMLLVGGYSFYQLNKISSVRFDKSPKALGISPVALAQRDSVKEPPLSIALFGLDKRPGDLYGNSDVIMIISISEAAHKIKLSSIMRDTYVNIDSVGMDKINAAYRIGGPQLSVKALNQNFNLDIQNFVSVDFNGMAHAIDALDGVEIDVKKEEVQWINAYLDENNRNSKVKPPYVSKDGLQTLNGKQAVAYTRIRYVGNDWARTERQRTVMGLLLKKLKEAGPAEYPKIVSKILPYVETSMPKFQLLTLGANVFLNNIRTVEERRFPYRTESKGKIINGTWYLVTDLKATSKSLFDFIYEGTQSKH